MATVLTQNRAPKQSSPPRSCERSSALPPEPRFTAFRTAIVSANALSSSRGSEMATVLSPMLCRVRHE
jgi:hypothetical protein